MGVFDGGGSGCVYSSSLSKKIRVSFKRLFGRKRNLFVNACIVDGSNDWCIY